MSDGSWNREHEYGLSPYKQIDAANARQLISHFVESTAVHSRSKGWLPHVSLTLEHIPLIGPGEPETLHVMMDHEACARFIEVLQEGLHAAIEDAKYGVREP